MNVLLLAPHPFYQDRGTPIAVDLLIKVLTEAGHTVDCLCFSEGTDRNYPNFRLFRAHGIPEVEGIRPGFSVKKLYMDLFFFFKFIGLFIRNRYDVVHAVEESAFMAMVVCKLFRRKFIYDMDSSMVTQLLDKSEKLRSMEGSLRWLESLPMRTAEAVVPVCDALADEVKKYRKDGIFILKDVSLVDNTPPSVDPANALREQYGIKGPVLMYIGNLESYQGIDLMLESFALAVREVPESCLIVIGGEDEHIAGYQKKAKALGLEQKALFLGKRPVSQINDFMSQADLLVSPRVHGVNTPMKVYSYLDSGIAVLATRLPTHTQVMTDEFGFLAADTAEAFSTAMIEALKSPKLRAEKAKAAKAMIAREHSIEAFSRQLKVVYDYVGRGR
ncbi:MAG: glycosyltransferase family 4 protein [Hahellaceae bacterium]|nr:glycosyltransferase family 4 protein [Hahellaceae bacterium]